MSAPSTLGMTPARRRIFEAGLAAQARMAQDKTLLIERRRRSDLASILPRVRVNAEKLAEALNGSRNKKRVPADLRRARMIVGLTAWEHGLTFEDLTGRSRKVPIVAVRQNVMWKLVSECGLSLPQTGRILGNRDHTTVLHGVRRHQARLDAARTTPSEATS